MPLAWRALPTHAQIDVLLSEQLRHGHLPAVPRCARERALWTQALEERGRVWDRNQLPAAVQRQYLQTAAYFVATDWRALQVRARVRALLAGAQGVPAARCAASR
jgi:hypothetical protein